MAWGLKMMSPWSTLLSAQEAHLHGPCQWAPTAGWDPVGFGQRGGLAGWEGDVRVRSGALLCLPLPKVVALRCGLCTRLSIQVPVPSLPLMSPGLGVTREPLCQGHYAFRFPSTLPSFV